MKKFFYITISLVLLLVFLSCEKPEYILGGRSYFPDKNGSMWIYSDGTYSENPDLKVEIIGDVIHPDYGNVMEVEESLYNDDSQSYEIFGTYYLLVDESGAYRIPSLLYSARIIYLLFPLSVGKVWSWDYSDGGDYYIFVGKIVSLEDVSTPYGDFNDCVKVEYYFEDPDNPTVIFYSDEVGIVRIMEMGVRDYELLDYSIP